MDAACASADVAYWASLFYTSVSKLLGNSTLMFTYRLKLLDYWQKKHELSFLTGRY